MIRQAEVWGRLQGERPWCLHRLKRAAQAVTLPPQLIVLAPQAVGFVGQVEHVRKGDKHAPEFVAAPIVL